MDWKSELTCAGLTVSTLAYLEAETTLAYDEIYGAFFCAERQGDGLQRGR